MKDFTILHKDNNLVIVNKSAGLSVAECQEKLSKYLSVSVIKPPAHANLSLFSVGDLDDAVSGIQVFGLNPSILAELEKNWNTQWFSREYLALVKGDIPGSSTIHFDLKDKSKNVRPAVTEFQPIKSFGIATLLHIKPVTDSKHQIRRHFSRRCMNIIGDKKFGQKKWNDFFRIEFDLNRIFLHAHLLQLKLKSYNRTIEINCPLPDTLETVLQKITIFYQSPEVLSHPAWNSLLLDREGEEC